MINRSSDEESQRLFDELIKYLARRGLLAKFFIGGILYPQMLMILNRVAREKRIAKVEIPWRGLPTPDLTAFWKSMQNFLDGAPGRAIILGLGGYHDHWTVIESVADRSVLLYDSALIKRLPRFRCTTGEPNQKRPHALLPAQTFFLSNEA